MTSTGSLRPGAAAAASEIEVTATQTGLWRAVELSIRDVDQLMFSLESQVGHGLLDSTEIPAWRQVLETAGPVWGVWPEYAMAHSDAIMRTPEWRRMAEAVRLCVDDLGRWHEEVEYPVLAATRDAQIGCRDWAELKLVLTRLDTDPGVEDRLHRRLEVSRRPAPELLRVSLPPAGTESGWALRIARIRARKVSSPSRRRRS